MMARKEYEKENKNCSNSNIQYIVSNTCQSDIKEPMPTIMGNIISSNKTELKLFSIVRGQDLYSRTKPRSINYP